MKAEIRPYHPSDLVSLYRICLKTADSGKDATGMFSDPDLPGHVYAAPYAVLEPELCFVLTLDEVPTGYILGTSDSERFYRKSLEQWFSVLQLRYPMPADDAGGKDAFMIRKIHHGHIPRPECSDYPAHLHIDLLPEAQGLGMGRKLIETFREALSKRGIPALHLEVGKANPGAVAFYERTGFTRIKEYEYSIAFGCQL